MAGRRQIRQGSPAANTGVEKIDDSKEAVSEPVWRIYHLESEDVPLQESTDVLIVPEAKQVILLLPVHKLDTSYPTSRRECVAGLIINKQDAGWPCSRGGCELGHVTSDLYFGWAGKDKPCWVAGPGHIPFTEGSLNENLTYGGCHMVRLNKDDIVKLVQLEKCNMYEKAMEYLPTHSKKRTLSKNDDNKRRRIGWPTTQKKDGELLLLEPDETEKVQVKDPKTGQVRRGVHYIMKMRALAYYKASLPEADGIKFVFAMTLVRAGILGLTQKGDREFTLSGRDLIVDPCALMTVRNFIQMKTDGTVALVRGPDNAWDLPNQIYKSIKVPGNECSLSEASEFPPQVRKKITKVGDAAFFQYRYLHADGDQNEVEANVVHCAGWNFNPDHRVVEKGDASAPYAKHDDAIVLLSDCYKKLFEEIASASRDHSFENIYLAPISGGVKLKTSGLEENFPSITFHAMALAFDQLASTDKAQIQKFKFNLCIWDVGQQESYEQTLLAGKAQWQEVNGASKCMQSIC